MSSDRFSLTGTILFAGYTMTIAAANWTTSLWPAVTIAGLLLPAGALLTGLIFTMRDLLQDAAGSRTALFAVASGAAVSGLIAEPRVALASAAAFALSELADLAVYTPLRRRSQLAAVGLSNVLGLLVDTLVFLPLAFGSLDQLVGKVVTTVLAVTLLSLTHRRPAPP
ncbi:VUT family protein [Amycolatopsis sp. TRM77291]